MRDLFVVIDQMISHIPNSDINMISSLKSVKGSIPYTPPESMSIRWMDVADILHRYLGDESKLVGWQRTVADIFMNRIEK